MSLVPFNTIIKPTAQSADALTFHITDDWLQGRSAFGGLQAAFALVAIRALTGVAAPLRVLQTTFVAPVGGGDVTVTAKTLRTGKSVTHVEARLQQGDDTLCLVVAVFGAARSSSIAIQLAPREAPPGPDGLRSLPFIAGMAPSFLQHFEMRWSGGGWPFSGSTESATRIWFKHRDPTGDDAEAALVALTDAIPSPAVSMLKTFMPASSLTWTLELLEPAPALGDGFWRIDSDIHAAKDGYIAQTAILHTPDNRPIALSRQSAVIFA